MATTWTLHSHSQPTDHQFALAQAERFFVEHANSPTIINERLAELRAAKLVMLDDESGYRLTTSGTELIELFLPLHAWSEKWAKRLSL